MRIWILNVKTFNGSAATPMLHHMYTSSVQDSPSQVYNDLLTACEVYSQSWENNIPFTLPIPAAMLLPIRLPDILLFVEQDSILQLRNLRNSTLHELGHSSHYRKVGNNYWFKYIVHILTHNGYGSDSTGNFAGYCGIGEMWGNFVAGYFEQISLGASYPYLYSNNIPHIFTPYESWFKPGILSQIHNDAGTDIGVIYKSLISEVHDLQTLKVLLMYYGIPEDVIDVLWNTRRCY